MVKRYFGTCAAATMIAVAGKILSDYAETKPELKNVKDKLKKTGKDFYADCKDVIDAARRAITGELPDEGTAVAEPC